MTEGWSLRTVPLKFQVASRTLLTVPLLVHTRSLSLADRAATVADPAPPLHVPLGNAAGYMVRAQPTTAALPTVAMRGGLIRYVTLQYGHSYIDLSIGLEAYRQKFSSKTRSTIARKVRRFQDHCGGHLHWKVYRDAQDMAEFHRLACEVSAKTYQEKLLDAGIPAGEDFLADMIARANRDEVRAFILFHGDVPVSYLYCPAQRRALIYAYLGYDPEYVRLSVGTVLQWLALEHLFNEAAFDLFDFTEGQSEHKRLFATHELHCANILFLKRSLWHAALVRVHAAFDGLVSATRDAADRWGLKPRLRRLMRFGWADPR